MSEQNNEETTIRVSKIALETLRLKAKPFESKKQVLERVIMQSCIPSKTSEVEARTAAESESNGE